MGFNLFIRDFLVDFFATCGCVVYVRQLVFRCLVAVFTNVWVSGQFRHQSIFILTTNQIIVGQYAT